MAYDPTVSQPADAADRSRSTGDLLRQLLGDVSVLLRKELALAASEISQSVNEAKHGAQSMVTGGAVLYAGALFLLAAVTLGLATMMDTWLAALIVGAVVSAIGAVMVGAGKKHMSAGSLAPERAMASLSKDKRAVERAMP